jgi:nucleotide-binding universal stress UspA family protein
MSGNNGSTSRIVVGVDGSRSSLAALRWAIHQAELTGDTVDAVNVWRYPVPPVDIGMASMTTLGNFDAQSIAGKVLDDAISATVDSGSGVKITATVKQGHPAQVLLDAASRADLLVVGSRGYGGFTEALLGSVGQECVHHAQCPVVVVR